ncbi:hypothetical protein AVEN_53505-1 [Araneus ventricosus]|uniref:Uncharacterized protein n=1 Tax=Araneus ventricosus TaxID=182803 RepID=A0A4Y2JDQ9_ARAVE|nr:hypothetical protein AVEN_53505-1 [Araneus ventricosus]
MFVEIIFSANQLLTMRKEQTQRTINHRLSVANGRGDFGRGLENVLHCRFCLEGSSEVLRERPTTLEQVPRERNGRNLGNLETGPLGVRLKARIQFGAERFARRSLKLFLE